MKRIIFGLFFSLMMVFMAFKSFASVSCQDSLNLKDCLQRLIKDLNEKDQIIAQLQNRLNSQGVLSARKCNGNLYTCLPSECPALCSSFKERMATVEEVLKTASKKINICDAMWALRSGSSSGEVASVFPMFENRTDYMCGVMNTGEFPRVTGGETTFNKDGYHIQSDGTFGTIQNRLDCACITD